MGKLIRKANGRRVRNKAAGNRRTGPNSVAAKFNRKPSVRKKDAARKRARRLAIKSGLIRKGSTKDIDHKDGNVNNNALSNLRAVPRGSNRSFRRNSKGKRISQTSKSERRMRKRKS